MKRKELSSEDFINGIPKAIQYKSLADACQYGNAFYLTHHGKNGIVGSRYYIEGGDWTLLITKYDPKTGILTGIPTVGGDEREYIAITMKACIDHRYIHGNNVLDSAHLNTLVKLKMEQR